MALLVGAGMTFLVQSSSVFTSAITPLIGNTHVHARTHARTRIRLCQQICFTTRLNFALLVFNTLQLAWFNINRTVEDKVIYVMKPACVGYLFTSKHISVIRKCLSCSV